MGGAITWLRSNKKLLGTIVAFGAGGARALGQEGAAHVLELVAAALFGGGLRSDAGVKQDEGLKP